MARATIEIVASATDRASSVLNRIGESGRVAAQRVGTAWGALSAPFTAITRRIKLVEASLFAFLGSQAVRGLDKFFDRFGGARYDAARSGFVTSMNRLGESLGRTLGPKFSDALDKLGGWVDKHGDRLVGTFNSLADAIISTTTALGSLYVKLSDSMTPRQAGTDAYNQRLAARGWTPEDVARWQQRSQQRALDEMNERLGSGLGRVPGDTFQNLGGGLMFPPWVIRAIEMERINRAHRVTPTMLGQDPWHGIDMPRPPESVYNRPGPAPIPQPTFMDRLRNEWAEGTREMEERGLHLARTLNYGLSDALTNTILGVEKASDAFKMFAKSIVATIVQMFVDSGVRRFLGLFASGIGGGGGGGGGDSGLILPGGGGPGTLGLGGGGGGGDVHYHINAVDSQSFSQALRRAEMERGAVAKITLNSANHNPTLRRGLQLR